MLSSDPQFLPSTAEGVLRGAVRVLVVEDEAPVRERLCATVAADRRLLLAGAATDLASGLALLQRLGGVCDVLLVDLGLPDGSGLELIRACRRDWPAVDVLVMTLFGDERHVFEALEAGAHGYLLKSFEAAQTVEHVLDVAAGGSPVTPTVARLLLRRLAGGGLVRGSRRPPAAQAQPLDLADEGLTSREIEVLDQIAIGFSYAEIAQRLGISVHTVTTHIRRIYQKLEVHSRSAAVFEAGRRGWLTPVPPAGRGG